MSSSPLEAGVRTESVAALLPCLHTMYDLKIHAALAHWNVRGPRFEIHEETRKLCEMLWKCVDQIAERIMQLGHTVPANATEIEAGSVLKEWSSSETDEVTIVGMLADSLLVLVEELNKAAAETRGLGDLVSGHIIEHCQMCVEKATAFFVIAAGRGNDNGGSSIEEPQSTPAGAGT